MDLLEYQAKELFRQVGIPVLPSQRINYPQELKGLRIPYPVVLKSQVRVGGRAKAGGVKFAGNTIDAVAAAQSIFHLSIKGEYPKVLLAEAKYNPEQEFYLAIVLDRAVRRPVLLGSTQGGIDVKLASQQMQQVVVHEKFSPFYARRLAVKMGLQGEPIDSVSGILEKMYQLFARYDLELIEINPLGIRANREVMALDGKVSVNDQALGRHASLTSLLVGMNGYPNSTQNAAGTTKVQDGGELDGNLAIVCNGIGLTLATLDLVYIAGGQPANFLNIGGDIPSATQPGSLEERLRLALEKVTQNPKVKAVLVNLLCSVTSCEHLAEAISSTVGRISASSRSPHLVVRLGGSGLKQAVKHLTTIDVALAHNLDDAVVRAVSLAASPESQAG